MYLRALLPTFALIALGFAGPIARLLNASCY